MKVNILILLFFMSCSTVDSSKNKIGDESIDQIKDADFTHVGEGHSPTNVEDALDVCRKQGLKDGLASFKPLYSASKKSPSYWNSLGVCYFTHGNERQALIQWNMALQIDPKNSDAYNNLGNFYLRNNENSKALVAFQKSLQLNSNNLSTKVNLFQLYVMYSLFDRASEFINDVVAHDDKKIYPSLATYFYEKGNYKKSIDYFEDVGLDGQCDLVFRYLKSLERSGNSISSDLKQLAAKCNFSEKI